jgi:hypothetical protein
MYLCARAFLREENVSLLWKLIFWHLVQFRDCAMRIAGVQEAKKREQPHVGPHAPSTDKPRSLIRYGCRTMRDECLL